MQSSVLKKVEMKKLKLSLKDVGEILTREQLKQVFGGSGGWGTCGWSGTGTSGPFCGISKEAAISNAAAYPGSNWCCDSCSTTYYCGHM